MINKTTFTASALTVLLAGSLAAQTTTVIRSDRDATIYSDINLNANGSGLSAFAGQTRQGGFRRALVRFDVAAALPAGATVQSAEVELNIDRLANSGNSSNFHRLTADWTEGPSTGTGQGSPAQLGDVTWDDRSFQVLPWTTAGGDFVLTSSGSGVVSGLGPQVFAGPGLAPDVASWLANPASNFGWIIVGDENRGQGGSAYSFSSREIPLSAPILRVTWTMGGTPASATPFGAGCMGASLSANGAPSIGNANFALSVTGGPTNLTPYSALVATGQLPGPLGIFNCFLLVNPSRIIATLQFNGMMNRPLPIPIDPGNMGLTLYVQAAALDLATPGVVTTNGITLVVGN